MKNKVFSKLLIFSLTMIATSLYAQKALVEVNLSTALNFGNEITPCVLDRSKFFNSHTSPGNDFTPQEWEYLESLRMGMGRSFMLPGAGGILAQGDDREAMKTRTKQWGKYSKNYYGFSPQMMKEVILTSHPTPSKGNNYFFHWKGVGADYSDEADYISDFLQMQFIDNGLELPGYIEPMNEPYVHTSDYKKNGIADATDASVRVEMAHMHTAIAKELHRRFPGIKVGGYASAWPYMEGFNSDFKHWHQRMKMFIDATEGQMDFYSIHIYDGKNVKGEDTFRSGSNMEGIMDLMEAYCFLKFGKVKPLLISEHGMTRPDWEQQSYSDERDWKILRSTCHQTMQFMSRPDNLLKCVPFFTGKASWWKAPYSYPWVLSKKDEKGNWKWTHLVKFFELWKDVKGYYVKTVSHEPDVLSLAFVDNNKAYIVLNAFEENTDVALNVYSLEGNTLKGVKLRRLYQTNGKPVIEDKKLKKCLYQEINMEVDETCIVTYEFKKAVQQKTIVHQRKFYASTYLQPVKAKSKQTFDISINKGKIDSAVLQIGIARPTGQSIQPTLKVNDRDYPFPTDWKGYDQKNRVKEGFFGVIDIPLDANDVLQGTNHIQVQFPDGNGTISTVAMSVGYGIQ